MFAAGSSRKSMVFRATFKPDPSDFVIVVMGPTGSGKSNFINNLTGNTEKVNASHLKSATQCVTAYPVSFPGSPGRLVLVDTPGFDDTNRPDFDILKTIADWLTQKYPDNSTLRVAGIIYSHRITDNRMSGSAHKNLQMFGRLCGSIPLRRTRLVTTMWDIARDQAMTAHREDQLKTDFWRALIEGGASTHRFHNTPESAQEIVGSLLDMEQDGRSELLLQEELVEQQKHLNETEAGKVLYNRTQKLLAEQKRTLQELEAEAKEQNDPDLAKSLEEEIRKIDAQLQKTFEQMKEMKIPLSRRLWLWLFGRKSRSKAIELD